MLLTGRTVSICWRKPDTGMTGRRAESTTGSGLVKVQEVCAPPGIGPRCAYGPGTEVEGSI